MLGALDHLQSRLLNCPDCMILAERGIIGATAANAAIVSAARVLRLRIL
jgi:hypothetical protein